ncbi:MAG: pspA 2, partial [Frankiales bacterium]|nr:pspA 2 [Frankiales bacterium]
MTSPIEAAVEVPIEVPVPEPQLALSPTPANKLRGFMPDLAPPTTFVLVRHGVTAYTVAKRFCGSTDAPLNERGTAMAAAAAGRLVERAGVSVVVCSPLLRTRGTAEVIAAATGASLHVEDDLRECDFGEWEGLTFLEAQERFPDEITAWLADPEAAPPGG